MSISVTKHHEDAYMVQTKSRTTIIFVICFISFFHLSGWSLHPVGLERHVIPYYDHANIIKNLALNFAN